MGESSNTAHAAYQRGFSLVEAAIVLGVVGLVIGGIWVTASTMNKRLRINTTVRQISFIADCARNLLQPDQAVTSGSATQSFLYLAGCLPGDSSLRVDPITGVTITTAYNDHMLAHILGDGYIALQIPPSSLGDCNQLANGMVSAFGSGGEYLAKVVFQSWSAGIVEYLPADYGQSINKCPVNTTAQFFYFTIPRHR